jgi:hypothetical protein
MARADHDPGHAGMATQLQSTLTCPHCSQQATEMMPTDAGPVAKSDAGRRTGGTDPDFHALLTSGRPKQSARRLFCSHTVQAPAKPNPLRSHSIASNPWIVRRAVWKA